MAGMNERQKIGVMYPLEVERLPFFYSSIKNRLEAEEYLRQNCRGHGTFLIRPNSSNDPHFVSVSISIGPQEVCHAKVWIESINDQFKYYINDKLLFATFDELLRFYKDHHIHCKQNIQNVKLLHPLLLQRQGYTVGQPTTSHTRNRTKSEPVVSVPPLPERPPAPPSGRQGSSSARHGQELVTGSRPVHLGGGALPKHGVMTHRQSESNFFQDRPDPSEVRRQANKGRSQSFDIPCTSSGLLPGDDPTYWKYKPPLPLPLPELDKEDVYYTQIYNKDFFEDFYQHLKETDVCECGLNQVDSRLPMDWTVHRSNDRSTYQRIFFQKDSLTTWEMPDEIVPLMSDRERRFILFLCREGNSPVPKCLKKYLRLMGALDSNFTDAVAHLSSSGGSQGGTPTSRFSGCSSSSSSSSGSGQQILKQGTLSNFQQPSNSSMRGPGLWAQDFHQATPDGTVSSEVEYERPSSLFLLSSESAEGRQAMVVTVARGATGGYPPQVVSPGLAQSTPVVSSQNIAAQGQQQQQLQQQQPHQQQSQFYDTSDGGQSVKYMKVNTLQGRPVNMSEESWTPSADGTGSQR
ncbi:uncharacterized protein LOC101857467 isoform X2 [Aplysia californica]|uniref:Uncharacterized protein LOC101857467 isoform X2 n=1 Tax=Aplysia californica TaxID=6500 RepID=A0ABM0JEP4_APLCA|nr:uncharacterized protein LOC101857467 isoform X2 [Aplysia californica]